MSVQKVATRFSTKGKGILATSASGMGTDILMRTIDNIVGSPVQNIFGFNLPVIGNVGAIDILNYSVHAGGFKFSKNGLIAVAAAKIGQGVLPSIGSFKLPQAAQPAGTGSSQSAGASF
jgi:hypothetical protein